MAEPTISNSALLAEAGSGGRPGNKVRSLTTEELRLARAAEEVVQRELLLRSGRTPPPASVELSPGTIMPGTVIEAMNKKNQPAVSQAVAPPQISAPSPQAVIPPLPATPAPRVAVPPPPVQAKPAPVVAAPSQPATKSWSPSAKTVSVPASIPAAPIKASTPVTTPAVSKSSSPTVLKRKLTADELATVGKALEMTVKHRGGGPFGAGRLQGADLELLESSLRSAVQVLREDAQLAEPVVEVATTKTVARDPLPAIKLPTATQSQAPPLQKSVPVAPKAVVPPPVAVAQPQQVAPPRQAVAPPPQTMLVDEDAPMPIAMGIDRFLQNPKGSSYEELCGLRDAVIQVLAMIQGEIANSTPSPSAPLLMPTRPAVDPTDRIVKDFYSAPSAAEGSASDEESRLRELKLSLGLLLKHRGGPGFGHGRLEGKELDLMESKLRSAAEILREEASSA